MCMCGRRSLVVENGSADFLCAIPLLLLEAEKVRFILSIRRASKSIGKSCVGYL